MTPSSVRSPVPAALAVALAMCALLLLKWIAVVGLLAIALVVVVRWSWYGTWRAAVPALPRPRTGAVPLSRTWSRPLTVEHATPRALPAEGAQDCSWCGEPGGHRAADGSWVRPRYAHR